MLQLAIFDYYGGHLLYDWSARGNGLVVATNEHGFESLRCNVPLALAEAFAVYDRNGLPHVEINDGAERVWEGRLEDVTIQDDGLTLTALGYARALSDVPYTALWSACPAFSDWIQVTAAMLNYRAPERWEMDTNNRLYMAPRLGENFGTPGYFTGQYTYAIPSGGSRSVTKVTFTYEFKASSDWSAFLNSYNVDYSSGASEWSLTGNGATQSGTATVTLATARARLDFGMHCTAALGGYTGDTGDHHFTVTAIRLQTAATVTPEAIVAALATYVNGINALQMSASAVLIQATGLDLTDESYEDALPADILTKLAKLGGNTTAVAQWEWGVWEGQRLHFRLRGSAGRAWYVDASDLELQRSLDGLRNSAYAVYQDAQGKPVRTAASVDATSISRYGVTRQGVVAASTTSATQAALQRDAYLLDNSLLRPRAGIKMSRLYDVRGAQWPLWTARSGDTITVRSLPPTLSTEIDRIRTFRVSRTEYSADGDTLAVEPESPLPTLEVLLGRMGEGM